MLKNSRSALKSVKLNWIQTALDRLPATGIGCHFNFPSKNRIEASRSIVVTLAMTLKTKLSFN